MRFFSMVIVGFLLPSQEAFSLGSGAPFATFTVKVAFCPFEPVIVPV